MQNDGKTQRAISLLPPPRGGVVYVIYPTILKNLGHD